MLPPADGLAPAEQDRLTTMVALALDGWLPGGPDDPAPVVLEPADAASFADTVERALRRAGPDGTVCVIGVGARDRLDPLVVLYPSVRTCAVPAVAPDDGGPQAVDVDLEELGRRLGVAARGAALGGTILVLDGGDAMLDRQWRTGVVAGTRDASAEEAPNPVHVVRTAEAAVRLLEEQAELLERGVLPGSATPIEAEVPADGGDGADGEDDLPPALVLPPVRVVVLDASAEAALLVGPVAERGLLLVGPQSLIDDAGIADESVVMRWSIDWGTLVGRLLRSISSGGSPIVVDDVLVLEPGPRGDASASGGR